MLVTVRGRCCTLLLYRPAPVSLLNPAGARYGLADLRLFRPDISQVGADRASVMRCRRSLPFVVGRPRSAFAVVVDVQRGGRRSLQHLRGHSVQLDKIVSEPHVVGVLRLREPPEDHG